jgi:hypothetical protein
MWSNGQIQLGVWPLIIPKVAVPPLTAAPCAGALGAAADEQAASTSAAAPAIPVSQSSLSLTLAAIARHPRSD